MSYCGVQIKVKIIVSALPLISLNQIKYEVKPIPSLSSVLYSIIIYFYYIASLLLQAEAIYTQTVCGFTLI